MSNLKRMVLAISLAVVLTGTAFAGETSSPPCANPGETSSPPCIANPLVTDEDPNPNVPSEVEQFIMDTVTDAIESLLLTVF